MGLFSEDEMKHLSDDELSEYFKECQYNGLRQNLCVLIFDLVSHMKKMRELGVRYITQLNKDHPDPAELLKIVAEYSALESTIITDNKRLVQGNLQYAELSALREKKSLTQEKEQVIFEA